MAKHTVTIETAQEPDEDLAETLDVLIEEIGQLASRIHALETVVADASELLLGLTALLVEASEEDEEACADDDEGFDPTISAAYNDALTSTLDW